MSKLKFEPDWGGIQELENSPEIVAACLPHATQILERASASSPGYEMTEVHLGARGKLLAKTGYSVHPGDAESAMDNLRNNTLLKARGW